MVYYERCYCAEEAVCSIPEGIKNITPEEKAEAERAHKCIIESICKVLEYIKPHVDNGIFCKVRSLFRNRTYNFHINSMCRVNGRRWMNPSMGDIKRLVNGTISGTELNPEVFFKIFDHWVKQIKYNDAITSYHFTPEDKRNIFIKKEEPAEQKQETPGNTGETPNPTDEVR